MLFDLDAAVAPSLAGFIAGPGQRAALELAARAAKRAGSAYIWGPPGAGKTHLLAACRDDDDPGSPGRPLAAFDDVDRLDERGLGHLLAVLDQALQDDRQLVLATGPVAAAGLDIRADVRTRLAALPAARVEPLSDAQLGAALAGHAERLGRPLSGEVAAALVDRLPRSMDKLVAAFARLDSHAIATNTRLTAAAAVRWLDEDRAS